MRPLYHYAPAANWLSDPNGLVFHQGEWHLFYQYNPHGEDWGHMSWGHAVSTDLAHWQELPVAIPEGDQDMIFSGCAVIDAKGAAGFGKDAMIALYTASAAHGPAHQAQALAFSTDQGRSFTQYAANPVLDLGLADFRDPNVFWHDPTGRWIMVVALSAENRAVLYASRDLLHWDELSVIHGNGAPGRVWECPLLIELPVEGSTQTRWLFKVDALHDGPGSGAIYQSGTFDGIRFHPDGPDLAPIWQVADAGSDFYAAVAWHEPRDAQGRPAWIGWIGNHTYQGRLPKQGWRGAMSVPRRLSLVRDGAVYGLRQQVEPACLALAPEIDFGTASIGPAGRLSVPSGHDLVIVLADDEGRELRLERRGSLVVVTRRDAASPFLDHCGKLRIKTSAPIELLLDEGSLEIFADHGCATLTLQHRLRSGALSMRCDQLDPASS